MTNALAIYDRFDTLQRTAIALRESGYFKDVQNEAQAIVKVMAGAELGLPPFASMAGIHIVQGKPVLGSNVIATLVKNDPRYDYQITTATNETCTIEWYERGQPSGFSQFTFKEAQAAGLTGKDNWKKYPSDMLFARAISRGARRFAPGIFGGAPVYTPDEMGVGVDEDGYVEGEIIQPVVTSEPEPEEDNYTDHNQGPLPDDEQVMLETEQSQFFVAATALIDRYDHPNATANAAKKIGYEAIPKEATKRVEMYRAIRDYAAGRNAEEQGDLFAEEQS